ncbi:hypothetical protein CCYA_CCYA07G2128 [Cyanidiococcus yangmingshanensis]|nr:hypothetical protein CCYA_CCYA07G2128 [Cyanidiococcus yangmingshanensis]
MQTGEAPPASLHSFWYAVLVRALKALGKVHTNRESFSTREIVDHVESNWDSVSQGAEFRRKFSVELTKRLQTDSDLVEVDTSVASEGNEHQRELYWKLRPQVDSYNWDLVVVDQTRYERDDPDVTLEPASKRARLAASEQLASSPSPSLPSEETSSPATAEKSGNLSDIVTGCSNARPSSHQSSVEAAKTLAASSENVSVPPNSIRSTRVRQAGHSTRPGASEGGQRTIRRGGLVAQFSESVLARLKAGVPIEEIDPLELIDDPAILEWRQPPTGVAFTLSVHQRDPRLTLLPDQLTVIGERGFRSIRGIHGVATADWYFEIEVLAGEPPSLPSHEAVIDRDAVRPHLRVGYGSCRAEVSFPVGWEVHAYAYRDKTGDKVHDCVPVAYGEPWGQVGDVIGCRIHLPPVLDDREQTLIRQCDDAWFDFKGMNMGLGSKPKMPPQEELYYTVDRGSHATSASGGKGTWVEFFKNGVSQGVAYRNLIPAVYYPMISLYMGAKCRANFGAEPFRAVLPPGCRPLSESTPPSWLTKSEPTASNPAFHSDRVSSMKPTPTSALC